ncbi:MAG: hypothetical protein KF753_11760 [Caldilineaceae bacterium]|nr:hypothetical protein [Caldilineaceae bacterium]
MKIKYPSVLLLCMSLLAGLAFFAGSARAETPVYGAATEPAWRAVYWNNTTLSGQPAFFRDETILDHNWGLGSPDASVNDNNFSARWTRVVDLPAGRYRFSITGDDGVRVYVNDELFVNGWWDHGVRTFTTDRDMPAGQHEVRVEFYERYGAAVVKFSLETLSIAPPGSPTVTPTPAPAPPPPSGKPPVAAPEDGAWRGEYYNNETLSGAPAAVRADAAIEFDWGHGSPIAGVLNENNFSVRWTRNLHFAGGLWRFTTTTDDGVRLWVDGELVIDQWRLMKGESHEAKVLLQEGVHSIKMEYFERSGGAMAILSIQHDEVQSGKGNLITCVPPNPPNYAWIRVYRKDPSTGQWYRAIPKGIGSIHASGYLKIDGLPVDIAIYGDAGEPYWIEQWIDGKVARSVGNTDQGDAEFRIRPSADNYTPWGCAK